MVSVILAIGLLIDYLTSAFAFRALHFEMDTKSRKNRRKIKCSVCALTMCFDSFSKHARTQHLGIKVEAREINVQKISAFFSSDSEPVAVSIMKLNIDI